MGWRESWFPWRRRPAPAAGDDQNGQKSRGDVNHELLRGKFQPQHNTIHTAKRSSHIDAPLKDVNHEEPHGKSQHGEAILHTIKLPSDIQAVPLDIVAIHGLNGHWEKSWTNPQDKTFLWLRDLIPTKFPGARIMSFEYNAQAIASISPAGVRDHAANLVKLLVDEREDLEDKNRPILFVVHSLGGIIVKQALRKATDEGKKKGPSQADALDISNSTKGIVFFGTPHRGSEAAKWASIVADVASAVLNRPKSQLLEALETNSDDLTEISEDFSPLASRYAIASFYESNVHRGLGTVVVGKASAIMALPHEETFMLGGDHSSMCKLGRDDRRWNTVWRAMRRCAKGVDG